MSDGVRNPTVDIKRYTNVDWLYLNETLIQCNHDIYKPMFHKILKKYPICSIAVFGSTRELFNIYNTKELDYRFNLLLERYYGTTNRKKIIECTDHDKHKNFLNKLVRISKVILRYVSSRSIAEKVSTSFVEILSQYYMDHLSDSNFKCTDVLFYSIAYDPNSSLPSVGDNNKSPSYDDMVFSRYVPFMYSNFQNVVSSWYIDINCQQEHLAKDVIKNFLDYIDTEIYKEVIYGNIDKVESLYDLDCMKWLKNGTVIKCANAIVARDKDNNTRLYLLPNRIDCIGVFDKEHPFTIVHNDLINGNPIIITSNTKRTIGFSEESIVSSYDVPVSTVITASDRKSDPIVKMLYDIVLSSITKTFNRVKYVDTNYNNLYSNTFDYLYWFYMNTLIKKYYIDVPLMYTYRSDLISRDSGAVNERVYGTWQVSFSIEPQKPSYRDGNPHALYNPTSCDRLLTTIQQLVFKVKYNICNLKILDDAVSIPIAFTFDMDKNSAFVDIDLFEMKNEGMHPIIEFTGTLSENNSKMAFAIVDRAKEEFYNKVYPEALRGIVMYTKEHLLKEAHPMIRCIYEYLCKCAIIYKKKRMEEAPTFTEIAFNGSFSNFVTEYRYYNIDSYSSKMEEDAAKKQYKFLDMRMVFMYGYTSGIVIRNNNTDDRKDDNHGRKEGTSS